MSFTTVPDKAAGDVFTEAMWDTYLRDNLNSGVLRMLADSTLGAGAANIDFTSIPATFAHLILEITARGDTAAASAELWMRLNGDTGANYDSVYAQIRHSATLTTTEAIAAAQMNLGQIPAANAPANAFGAARIMLAHYAGTVAHKQATSQIAAVLAAVTPAAFLYLGGSRWRNTAAINRVTLLPGAGNFAAGTRVTLYGMPA